MNHNAMRELEIPALVEKLPEVQSFTGEIFAHYAYAPGTGMVKVRVEVSRDPPNAAITFIDSGRPLIQL